MKQNLVTNNLQRLVDGQYKRARYIDGKIFMNEFCESKAVHTIHKSAFGSVFMYQK